MRALTLVPLLVLLGGVPAAGQASQASARADVQAAIGWQNLHQDTTLGGNDWMNDILQGNVAASWYWTEHLRTQLDLGAGTEGRQYRGEATVVDGQQAFVSSRLLLQQRSLGIGQQYQFFHNAWFHPHVGAGALIVFERRSEEFQPTYVYDPRTGSSRVVAPPQAGGPTTRTFVRPFVDLGLKAYLSPRAYFVHDTRLVPGSGRMEQVTFTFGFGVDF